MKAYQADIAKFEGTETQVFGVSVDSIPANKRFAQDIGVTFPLLSDFQHKVAQAYEVVWPDFAGLGPGTARAVFIIDRQGIVRYAEQTPTLMDFPNYEAIDAALSEIG